VSIKGLSHFLQEDDPPTPYSGVSDCCPMLHLSMVCLSVSPSLRLSVSLSLCLCLPLAPSMVAFFFVRSLIKNIA